MLAFQSPKLNFKNGPLRFFLGGWVGLTCCTYCITSILSSPSSFTPTLLAVKSDSKTPPSPGNAEMPTVIDVAVQGLRNTRRQIELPKKSFLSFFSTRAQCCQKANAEISGTRTKNARSVRLFVTVSSKIFDAIIEPVKKNPEHLLDAFLMRRLKKPSESARWQHCSTAEDKEDYQIFYYYARFSERNL